MIVESSEIVSAICWYANIAGSEIVSATRKISSTTDSSRQGSFKSLLEVLPESLYLVSSPTCSENENMKNKF